MKRYFIAIAAIASAPSFSNYRHGGNARSPSRSWPQASSKNCDLRNVVCGPSAISEMSEMGSRR